MHELRAFMFERVYDSETAAGQKHVAIDVIRRLVDHHLAHPELIPATYRDTEADAVTQVVDYVSGMTDRFALTMHDRLFDADATSQMTPLLGIPYDQPRPRTRGRATTRLVLDRRRRPGDPRSAVERALIHDLASDEAAQRGPGPAPGRGASGGAQLAGSPRRRR